VNILVLGGNRFFGKEVLKKLLSKNHKVYLVNRCTRKNLSHKNLELICTDRKDLKKYYNLFDKIYFEKIFDNIAYSLNEVKLLINLLKGKFNHYILTSSSISYLDINTNSEKKEKDWKKGRITNDFKKKYNITDIKYAINKRKIENFLINNKKILSTIIRIPNVIGKEDFSKKTQKLIRFNYNPQKNKNFEDRFIQFIFKDDLVKIILKIINSKPNKKEQYNIANEKIKIKDFYYSILKNKNLKKKYLSFTCDEFPMPINTLLDCKKIKKKFKINFSNLNKILNSI
tara:strand:+ start:2423 stop:3280 length:858 start_codon:yes stop_codon:yes gene_type:complete